MREDALVVPTEATDRRPSIGVARELRGILGVNSSVVLDGHTIAWKGQVEFGDEGAALVEELPCDLRFGQFRVTQQQTESGLSR